MLEAIQHQVRRVTSKGALIEIGSESVPAHVWQRVVRQTLEAVLFEQLVDYIAAPNNGSVTFYFGLDGQGYSCRGKRRGFGRIALDIASLQRVGGHQRALDYPAFLNDLLLQLPGDKVRKDVLRQELSQTAAWCTWNERHLPHTENRRDLGFAQLEAALHEGHPYHPCFKSRTGFDREDQRRYSPEAAEPITVHWLAVPRHLVNAQLPEAPGFWQRELGQDLFEELNGRCARAGESLAAFELVPVHPWQWVNRIAERVRLANAGLIHLGQLGDAYLASQSVRTLINITSPEKANLKLPLDIVNTSSRRYLQSHGVESAPVISQWLKRVVETDEFFQHFPLIILEEYAGIRVREEAIFNTDAALCQLGAVWRQSIEPLLQAGERAAPMTALTVVESDGRPFIDPWVRLYGLKPWLERLFRTLVLPIWHLLARHGLAIEAHAQNTIILHKDGWPSRSAVRDFHESLEYVNDFLADSDQAPDFQGCPLYEGAKPNQFYWMDSVEALRELFMDTLYVYHLSELAGLCERFYQLPETGFWTLLGEVLDGYARDGHCAPGRLAMIGHTHPKIRAESLLRKKLCPGSDEYHHWVPNPFFRPLEQEVR